MMLRWGYHPKVETFEMILSCLCKMGKIVEAHQVLGLLITLGSAVSVNVWSMLMNGFCRLQRLDVAGKLLEKMVETDSFAKAGRCDDAIDVFVSMQSRNLAPDSCTVSSLLSTLCLSRRFDMLPKLVRGLDIEADLLL
ncbi:hypothetical protein ACFX1Q_025568 [Malus domestica]